MITEFSSPILSTSPLQTGFSSGILKSWYLMELLPEFTTKMFILFLLTLNGSNDNRIENIIYRTAAAQIIYRFIQSLQHGADCQMHLFHAVRPYMYCCLY